MLRSLRHRFTHFFQSWDRLPRVTQNSTLHEISQQYPDMYRFLERKYGIKNEPELRQLSLNKVTEEYGLPPPQILFMEIQLNESHSHIEQLTPLEAKTLIDTHPSIIILDVREEWEIKICKLSNSRTMTPKLLNEILSDWPKGEPVLIYCHFGVRSLDAATFLADRGFKSVFILRGGIEAWSIDVDPHLPRYDSAYC